MKMHLIISSVFLTTSLFCGTSLCTEKRNLKLNSRLCHGFEHFLSGGVLRIPL